MNVWLLMALTGLLAWAAVAALGFGVMWYQKHR